MELVKSSVEERYDNINDVIVANLDILHRKTKLGYKDFAKEIGICYGSWVNWRNNEKEISLFQVIKITDYFNITVDQLLDKWFCKYFRLNSFNIIDDVGIFKASIDNLWDEGLSSILDEVNDTTILEEASIFNNAIEKLLKDVPASLAKEYEDMMDGLFAPYSSKRSHIRLGDNVDKICSKLGMSRVDLCVLVGISVTTMGKWDTLGYNFAKISAVVKIAHYFNMYVEDLIYGDTDVLSAYFKTDAFNKSLLRKELMIKLNDHPGWVLRKSLNKPELARLR